MIRELRQQFDDAFETLQTEVDDYWAATNGNRRSAGMGMRGGDSDEDSRRG
jgi:hypothetical protein